MHIIIKERDHARFREKKKNEEIASHDKSTRVSVSYRC